MSFPLSKSRIAVTTVVVCSFGVGLAGASGAQAFEHHLALGKARDSARDVESKRQALEVSFDRAAGVAQDAVVMADDMRVVDATQSLTYGTELATGVAAANEVEVAVAPVVAVARKSPVLAADTPLQRAATASAVLAKAPPETPSDADLSQVVDDESVAKVIAGESNSVDDVRAAADKLNEVGDALDAAAKRVDALSDSVEAATDAARLDRDNQELDSALLGVAPAIDVAMATIDAIGVRVTDSTVTSAIDESVAVLQEAASAAEGQERTDLTTVTTSLASVRQATTALSLTVTAAKAAHTTWVDAENARRASTDSQLLEDYQGTLATALADHADQNNEFVAARSNGWTGTPSLVNGSNGGLASGSLCSVSFDSGQFLQCDAAHALEDADDAYFEQTGRHLVMTDSYRSYSLQVITRAKKPTTAAVPGTSNHGWGMAIDLDPASAAWLTSHGADYGWVHPDWASAGGSRPESWHLEYVAPEVGGFEAPAAPELLEPAQNAFEQE
jgi:LAS superfamily LD-carboxypeptidase LdcB